jgi:hypothetical protein
LTCDLVPALANQRLSNAFPCVIRATESPVKSHDKTQVATTL